jgi:hypothetical protein
MMARIKHVTDAIPEVASSESQKTVWNLWLKTLLIIHVSTYLPYKAGIKNIYTEIPKLIAK